MENKDYNRLIYDNNLEELANIWNISDLTRYKYLKKYLLEYLLEKNIHTQVMDNFAITKKLWIELYLKYNITKPLISAPLDKLLMVENNELLLETLLKKLTNDERIELYYNLKKDSYWLFRNHETRIINIYERLGIKLPRIFIKLPAITEKNIKLGKRLEYIFDKFKMYFPDTETNAFKTYYNEFTRISKINANRAYDDMIKLIALKKKNPSFKLTLYDYDNSINAHGGEYDSYRKKIIINEYRQGILFHELSHMLYDRFEQYENGDAYLKYHEIQKRIYNSRIIKNIIDYIKDFHTRCKYMLSIFKELYFNEVIKTYGSIDNYYKIIYSDLVKIKPEIIELDNDNTYIFMDDDNISDVVEELIECECREYTDILINNYYTEELMLENLLDALLNGAIFDDNYGIECLSGHSGSYFKDEEDASFDEVLADYDAIKTSIRADRLTNKLRELVGDELIDFLDDYIETYRGKKQKVLR